MEKEEHVEGPDLSPKFKPAQNPITYSKQLDDEPKYVQYCPKNAANSGTIEDIINKIYYRGGDDLKYRKSLQSYEQS